MYTSGVLSSKTVIAAGVESLRRQGLEALGIRPLAERLGVTPMALYRHVATAQALSDAVVDEVLSQVPVVAAEGDFEATARTWARGARAVLTSFHGVARHILTHWFELPRALDWIEGLLAAAERDGMRGREGVAAVNSVFTYVLMRAELEQGVRQARVVHRKLPRGRKHEGRWPRIRANASEYETAHFDVYFEYGLDALLAGIAAVHEREE
jgi:AcrR family transcriptional regulator